eukprot:scaffold1284_cov353-Prasinococcus_capsulatus_cf.AAC.6
MGCCGPPHMRQTRGCLSTWGAYQYAAGHNSFCIIYAYLLSEWRRPLSRCERGTGGGGSDQSVAQALRPTALILREVEVELIHRPDRDRPRGARSGAASHARTHGHHTARGARPGGGGGAGRGGPRARTTATHARAAHGGLLP